MQTKPDNGVPLLVFGRVDRWDGLASYFTLLGIETTADALQTRRRRYSLPCRGGGTKGKPVYFTTKELDAWMKHLRGCTLQAWLDRQQRRRDDELDLLGGPPGRRLAPRQPPFPAFDLYALTTRRYGAPEHLLRDDDGYLYAARDPAIFSERAAMTEDDLRDTHAWRYYEMRKATRTDLQEPNASAKQRRQYAGRLVGAVVQHGSALRWCHVPGPLFGLPQGTMTIFLATWRQSGLQAAIKWIEDHEPSATLLTWPRRQELDPVVLEELPDPGAQDG
jgi:hypothetical protein